MKKVPGAESEVICGVEDGLVGRLEKKQYEAVVRDCTQALRTNDQAG